MNLLLFDRLDQIQGLYNNVRFISGPELTILEKYEEILEQHKQEKIRTCLLVHCNDMVIVTHFFRKIHSKLEQDLIENPNFEIILVTVFDYNLKCPLPLELPNFTWIYYPEYNAIYWGIYCDDIPIDKNEQIEYFFLSMNKRAGIFRQALCYKFYDNNWINSSIFTYLGESKNHISLFDVNTYKDIEKQIIEKNMYSPIPNTDQPIFITREDTLLDQYKLIPQINRIVNNSKITFDPSWAINREWYSKSYCSVTIETDPDNSIINLSEKTFRSIMMQHPLYLFAAEETYEYLSNLGLNLLEENQLWNNGKVFARFKIFLDHLDKIKPSTLTQAQILRAQLHDHSVHLRNQYYQLYKRMISKESEIKNQIFSKFEFLQKVY